MSLFDGPVDPRGPKLVIGESTQVVEQPNEKKYVAPNWIRSLLGWILVLAILGGVGWGTGVIQWVLARIGMPVG